MNRIDRIIAAYDGVALHIAAGTAIAAGAVLLALLAHHLLMLVGRKAAARTPSSTDDLIVERLALPLRWIFCAIALTAVLPALRLNDDAADIWQRVFGLGVPALMGWLLIAILNALQDVMIARTDITVEDNLRARRKRTRAGILHRITVFLVLVITLCMMLISIPSVRSIGVTLIASAGLAALAVGAAAQPALKNLIAGIQMAFTEPIRIDDVVVLDNEWGRIEEIRLTYVVIRIWDDRRLVVPVSRFLEQPFQNWTRESAQLLGNIVLYLDPTADIARLRAHLATVMDRMPLWDRRFHNLQVTDMKADMIEVRALMTAKDGPTAFDLRCAVREALLAYIAAEMPEALLRRRIAPADGDWPVTPSASPSPATAPPASADRTA
ncbi:mechanosensitive ion channel family protein [Sphingomonas montana]|uniref:mechanosensitive ion channel family protein n=1 Tax=Sphingomonas montana TaxID=1843236 RepID=UPI0009FB7E8A|nr:mechanosensitive ion channel domain-containing protein [Sphingomonas montana]